MTFLDANNGWAGGQDQTIDDVPGSIWKRSSSAFGSLGSHNDGAHRVAFRVWRVAGSTVPIRA